jgi:hypothetical protein
METVMEAIKEGVIVQLLRGGPDMLVVGLVDDFQWAEEVHRAALCVWEVDHLLNEKTFALSELALVSDAPSQYNLKGQRNIPGASFF